MTRLSFVLGLVLTLFVYQNCAELKSGMTSANSDNNQDGTGQGTNSEFLKGDPYDTSLIPFVLDDPEAIEVANVYRNLTGYKAMAFTENGDIYAAKNESTLIENQDDWNEAVLERCQLFFMNQPCSLFAEGDVIAQNRDDFIVGFNPVITVPATFDAFQVPGSINYWQSHHAATYPDFTNNPFKAFAIGSNGATHPGWSQDSQAEANRRALEFCEAISDEPCVLYAVGLDVVFDLENYAFDQKVLTWGPRAFVVDEIPFIPDSVREVIRAEYNQGLFYVLALDKFGYWFTVQSSTPIVQADRDAAIAGCNAKLPEPVPGASERSCYIYSIDDQVVVTRDDYTMATYGY